MELDKNGTAWLSGQWITGFRWILKNEVLGLSGFSGDWIGSSGWLFSGDIVFDRDVKMLHFPPCSCSFRHSAFFLRRLVIIRG